MATSENKGYERVNILPAKKSTFRVNILSFPAPCEKFSFHVFREKGNERSVLKFLISGVLIVYTYSFHSANL